VRSGRVAPLALLISSTTDLICSSASLKEMSVKSFSHFNFDKCAELAVGCSIPHDSINNIA